MMTKETIREASKIRIEASKKHSCEVSEIDWPSCMSMAMRGETLETTMEKEKIEKVVAAEAKHEYDFEISGDPRKGQVYLAVITGLCEKYGLERDFVNLPAINGRNEKTVLGKVLLVDGTIVEEKRGGSWKNDYADYYRCVGGEKEWLASWDDRKEIAKLFV